MNSVLSMLLVYYLISFVTFDLIVYLCFFCHRDRYVDLRICKGR